MKIKDKIAKTISYWLPNRLVYWVLIRAYAYTTVNSYPEKEPDKIGFGMITKSWETKIDLDVDDKGYVGVETVDHPNL